MKQFQLATAVILMFFATQAWGQSTYSGELIFSQGDFRQFDIAGAGPITGGLSGNNLVISSQGNYTYQGAQNALGWSISIDKNAASAMTAGTGVANYQGTFSYGLPQGTQTVIGAGQLNGASSNGTLTMQTYGGRMGVNGVNPADTTPDDWNTANFNWTMTMPTNTVRQMLGLQ